MICSKAATAPDVAAKTRGILLQGFPALVLMCEKVKGLLCTAPIDLLDKIH